MADYIRVRQVNTGYGRPRFSKLEIRDIVIAILALSLAFTIIYRNVELFSSNWTVNIICWFLTSLVMVTCSFLLHELGHKFVAQKYGAWSEFRMSALGLVLCVAVSFLGFLFAAPGAVYIRGLIDDRTNGKISIAGPAVNIVVGVIAFIIMMIVGMMPVSNTTYILYNIAYLVAHLNAFLALFNLLPIPPLDGSKIIKWNLPLWAGALAVSILLLIGVRALV